MKNFTSKIGAHVYVKNGEEAVSFYREAFKISQVDEPWLDENGLLIHQALLRDGEIFLGVSDITYLPKGFINNFSANVCPAMLFCVYFKSLEDLSKSYDVLSKDGVLRADIQAEGEDMICEIIDKYGVFWHLRFPKNQNALFIPK